MITYPSPGNEMYYIAAALLFFIGLAHSYLGERYILIRLFRRDNLPKLYGGTEFTKNTLRFAWHITTVAWWGFALILVSLAESEPSREFIGNTIGITFILHFLISGIGSKGKHFSWIFFLTIGLLALYVSNT